MIVSIKLKIVFMYVRRFDKVSEVLSNKRLFVKKNKLETFSFNLQLSCSTILN